jgi:hypothetical protein
MHHEKVATIQAVVLSKPTNLSLLQKGSGGWAVFMCDCGKPVRLLYTYFKTLKTKSCGCRKALAARARSTTHGAFKGYAPCTVEYRAWSCMKTRCYNRNRPEYKHYGGRGISVCDEWIDDFPAFLAHVGHRPPGMTSLDRIDNNKGYEPGNVRWATQTDQMRNSRLSVVITVDGVSKCAAEWAKDSPATANVILARVKKGWDHKSAVYRPLRITSKTKRAAQ